MVKKQLGKLSRVNKSKIFINVVMVIIMVATLAVTASADVTNDEVTTLVKDILGILRVVIIAIGAGLAIMGIVNLMEGYGNDNAGAKWQGR